MPGPTIVIGTAGHIDHGKTALLRALTGIDADRLPEERARGMTIDVGYAHLTFDDGVELDFVDVPGHDRLIGNMLVGAGEIDGALLVVAADDGPRPQTLEHLQLLDALDIRDGLAVVTKADLVDADRPAEVTAEVTALLADTSLAGAPVLAVSSTTGAGIEELRLALRGLSDALGRKAERRSPRRLAVDRVFSPKGRGVVVTGSLRGGLPLTAGDSLVREPGREVVRVREIQAHGATREFHAGGRAALNVAGEAAASLRRGDVLSDGSGVRGTDRLLVQLRRPAALGRSVAWPPRSRPGLRLHVGTAQAAATLRRIRGLDDVALITLGAPVATFAGDRAVLRDPALAVVVAGVRMLDLAPPRGVSRRRMTPERVAALATALDEDAAAAQPDAATAAAHHMAALVELHGALVAGAGTVHEARSEARSFVLADDVAAALDAEAIEAVIAHHRAAPLSAGLPLPRARAALLRRLRSLSTIERQHLELAAAEIARRLARLVHDGRLVRRGEALRDPTLPDDQPAELVAAMDRLEAALDVPAPPPLDEAAAGAGCPPEGIRALVADGRLVRLGTDLAWSTRAYHRLAGVALDLARSGPLTPAAFRDATGSSRRYVLAILEDLDRRGILQRTPEGHIPGPRAPRLEPV
jgi:selenocysteine-specific elongation factor